MILPLASGTFEPLAPSDRSADWAVTGRLGGVSSGLYASANIADHVGDTPESVAINREQLAHILGLTADDLVLMKPVHGADFLWMSTPGTAEAVDAVITDQPRIGLVAMGADCATIGIVGTRSPWSAPNSRVIAAVHCGWQGLCRNVLGATLEEMKRLGVTTFEAVIGPAICGDCYRVGEDRIERIRVECATHIAQAALVSPGGIDVRAGLLADLGARSIPVRVVGGCTYEEPDQFFSYRRDHVTGRQGLGITLKESPYGPL